MPIEFFTGLECDLVYKRWYGVVDFDQFERNIARYVADAHYRPGRRELVDHSGITEFNISSKLVRSMLRRVNEQNPDFAVQTHTVIFSPNETMFGLGRMYQLLAELADGIRVEVFQDEAEAMAALELPHTTIADLLSAEIFLPQAPRTG